VVWLPDTFGFTWALPTLMAAAGLRRFVTHKLSWSQINRIPHDAFRWRGPDGSDVLAHFLCTPSLWPGERTTYNGTLLPSIARGAYTGQARQKLRNALSQRLYHAAELFASTARALLGAAYPRESLEAGWRLILTNQFHDILPGSAISQVYVDAETDYQHLAALG